MRSIEAQVSAAPELNARILGPALLAVVLLGILALAASPVSASTVGPPPPPPGGACPSGLGDGLETPGGDLVIPFGYDSANGSSCYLAENATVSTSELLFYVFAPGGTGAFTIGVEEYDEHTVQTPEPGPNGTTIYVPSEVRTNIQWSNATAGGGSGWFGFTLTPPPQYAPSGKLLEVTLLGIVLSWSIALSPLLAPIAPVTLGTEILDYAVTLAAALGAFGISVLLARAIVRRVRYVRSVVVPSAILVLCVLIFGLWGAFVNPTSFAVLLAGLPLWWLFLPFFVAGTIFWIGVSPGKAPYVGVIMPSMKLVGGHTSGIQKTFRVWDNGIAAREYVRAGLRSTVGRLFGFRWFLDASVLTDNPFFLTNAEYESPKHDTLGWYRSFAEAPGRRPPIENFRPRLWFLPRRRSVMARRRDWLQASGRDPTLADTAGALFARDQGVRRVAAVDAPTFFLLEGYEWRTAKLTDVVEELHRTKRAVVIARTAFVTKVHDVAARLATISRISSTFPGHPTAVKKLDELAEQLEADLFGTRNWLEELREREGAGLHPADMTARPEALEDGIPRRVARRSEGAP